MTVRVGYLQVGCQVMLLAVFAASALGKVRGRVVWSSFVRSVRDLRLVPEAVARVAAAGTVAGELAVVLLLALPATRPAGLLVAGCLLTVFTASILVALRRGVHAVCACFGTSTALPLGPRHVVRNGLLLAVVVLGGVSLLPASATPHPAGLTVAAVAGLVGAAVVVGFDDIVDLFAGPVAGAGQTAQTSKGRA